MYRLCLVYVHMLCVLNNNMETRGWPQVLSTLFLRQAHLPVPEACGLGKAGCLLSPGICLSPLWYFNSSQTLAYVQEGNPSKWYLFLRARRANPASLNSRITYPRGTQSWEPGSLVSVLGEIPCIPRACWPWHRFTQYRRPLAVYPTWQRGCWVS